MGLTLKDIAVKILSGELPPLADSELADERVKICKPCAHYRPMLHQCDLCGCFLELKAKLLQAVCPINRW